MLGVIIQGMKKIATTVAKTVGKVAVKSTSFVSKRAAVNLRNFGNRMLSNMKSAKWWSKAARYVRKSGLISSAGNIGDALNKSGASNWLTKGLGAFKYDARSPKEYQKEYEYKTNLIENLKKKREGLLKEASLIKDELNKPTLSIQSIPEPGDKINALSVSIDQMKAGLAQVKMTQNKTNILLGGVSDDLTAHSGQISEAVLKSSESNIKVALTNAEEIKNHNMALHAENSQNIVSEINSHIDEVEQNRKDEEEEREKNDWKRKFFLNFLLIMEWILDFPGKIKMLLFKVGAILTLALISYMGAHWTELTAWMENGFGNFVKNIIKAVWGFIAKFFGIITELIGQLINGIDWIIEKLYFGHYKSDGENFIKNAGTALKDHSTKVNQEVMADTMEGLGIGTDSSKNSKSERNEVKERAAPAVKSIDANKPENANNLDVVEFNKSNNSQKSKIHDEGLENVDSYKSHKKNEKFDFDVKDPTGAKAIFSGSAGKPGWNTSGLNYDPYASPNITNTSDTVPNPTMSINTSTSQQKDENDMAIKQINNKLSVIHEDVNNTNNNVIKGTSKTMKAAASRPPTQVVNKVELKSANPSINPNL